MPKTRKRVIPPFEPKITNSDNQVSSTTQHPSAPFLSSLHRTSVVDTSSFKHGLGRGDQINRPSWQTSDKRTRYSQYMLLFLTLTLLIKNLCRSLLTTLYLLLSCYNSLPCIKLLIGMLSHDEDKMSILVDTGAVINTGNKTYHQWFMSQCPSMIDEYIECGSNTDYNVVQILAALDLKGTSQPVDNGSMTAVIRYETPCLIHNTDPFILSFALGTDVALRSVLGIPCLLFMGVVVDLENGQLDCKELNSMFPLHLDPPGKYLPDGSSYDSFSNTVPADIPTNVLPK